MQPIPIGNFDATQDEKGAWIYKARETGPLKKKNPVYQEKPEYKLQEEIEQHSKDRFRAVLNKTVLESVKFIKENL